MTVRELLARIDSRELSEWMAYYTLEPFGESRGDLRIAMLTSLMANVNRGKGQRPFKVQDFMPYAEKEEKSEVEELKDFLRRNTSVR